MHQARQSSSEGGGEPLSSQVQQTALEGEAARASDLVRGVSRALLARDLAVLTELPLANGRRADLVAIDRTGRITMVEIKTTRADFLTDRKWPAYLAFCHEFYFAVGAGFPLELLPRGEGVIVADRFGAEVVHPATLRPLSTARRKAMLLRFARASAQRLQALLDPPV